MREAGIGDPTDIARVRALGVIDLPTLQKKLNLHYSLSLDLFGSEISTNAASTFSAGLKGRFHETRIDDDHRLENATYPVLMLRNARIERVEEPALTALNMRLRDDYTHDCSNGVVRWNKVIEKSGIAFELRLPHTAFHRQIGAFADVQATPTGDLVDESTWLRRRDEWLPSPEDGDFIAALMKPVREPGQFASWIAPPKIGIDNKPGDFEYVPDCARRRRTCDGARTSERGRQRTDRPLTLLSGLPGPIGASGCLGGSPIEATPAAPVTRSIAPHDAIPAATPRRDANFQKSGLSAIGTSVSVPA